MTGIEYEVLHVQDPILYVIRKQHRISPTQGQLQQIIFNIDYFDLCQEMKIILSQLLMNPVVYRNTRNETGQVKNRNWWEADQFAVYKCS